MAVEVFEAGRNSGQLAIALIRVCRHVDCGRQRLRKALEAAVVFSGFGDFVEFAFGVLDLRRGCKVYRRVIGDVDHVLADDDQVAADGEVIDGTPVVLGIDDRCRLGSEPCQILTGIEPGDVEICR